MGEETIVLVSVCCATSRGRTRDGRGGCEGTSAYVAGEDVFILERSVMYTVNPCVGEGRKYVSIIRGAAEDVYVLVLEKNILCMPSHIRVPGRPFPLGLSKPITVNNMCSTSSLPLKTSDLSKQIKH